MTSHVVAFYSSNMVRSMRKPTWWTGASIEHYTINKSSFDDEESLASNGLRDTTPNVLDQPILVEALASQTIGLVVLLIDPSQSVVSRLVVVSGPTVLTVGFSQFGLSYGECFVG